ncbi:MAG: InlB B-repeat-containing protein [bacterium]|nr:InlB B-repeat-containing protein [bacterium]
MAFTANESVAIKTVKVIKDENTTILKKITVNDSIVVWSAGNTVTYICNGKTYQEEREEGESCLTPKTFTPAKSGWTFKGWSNNKGSASVLSSLAMGEEPVTLYAVFSHAGTTITTGQYYYSSNGNGNVTIEKEQSSGRIYIDTSAYSAVAVRTTSTSDWRSNYLTAKHNGDSVSMYYKIGSSSALVVTATHPWNDSGDVTEYPCYKTVSFNLADEGTQYFAIRLSITAGYANGWSVEMDVEPGLTITLTGRTMVG